jgi:hypothetical protein
MVSLSVFVVKGHVISSWGLQQPLGVLNAPGFKSFQELVAKFLAISNW